jgi:hypothetical protein
MKSLVVYYSHSGNTATVALNVFNALNERGEAEIVQLIHRRGRHDPFKRIFYHFAPQFVELNPVITDLGGYDLLCLGIPVLTAHPSAAVIKYINSLKGISGKLVLCCYVYGFEANARKCSRYVNKLIGKYGNIMILELYVPWSRVGDQPWLRNKIQETLCRIVLKTS